MKGFEKAFTNGYEQLSQDTKYRFAEIELIRAYYQLQKLYHFEPNPQQDAENLLFSILVPRPQQHPEISNDFNKLMFSNYFRSPRKDEIINYMRYKGVSYQKIRNLTKASFNTISNLRFGDPVHYPVFRHWNETMLNRWELAKTSINIFNEDTIPNKPWTTET